MSEKSPSVSELRAAFSGKPREVSPKMAELRARMDPKASPPADTLNRTRSAEKMVEANKFTPLPKAWSASNLVQQATREEIKAVQEGGRKDEGKKDEGKMEVIKKEEGKKDEGKMEAIKKEEGKNDEGKIEVVKKDEGGKEEIKKEEVKREEVRKDEMRKDEVKKDEVVAKKEEVPIPTKEAVVSKPTPIAVPTEEPHTIPMVSPAAGAKKYMSTDFALPPSIEEQDYMVLWVLSFVVPFFMLRFVFELVRRGVVAPARLAVRFAPGGSKLLSFMYVRLRPLARSSWISIQSRIPSMEALNIKARAGFETFLSTMQVAGGATWPHLLKVAQSIQTLKFREAASAAILAARAWAPMFLLLIPFTKNVIVGGRQGWLMFWRFSKTAFYLPFGSLLRTVVQNFGKTLTENPDVFAERMAGVLGPLLFVNVSIFAISCFLIWIGLIDYSTLSAFHIAWFFRLLGIVSEPSALLTAETGSVVLNTAAEVASVAAASAASVAVAAADAAAAAAGGDAGKGAAGWVW